MQTESEGKTSFRQSSTRSLRICCTFVVAAILFFAGSSEANANPGGSSSTLCGVCTQVEKEFIYLGVTYYGAIVECDWNPSEGWDHCASSWFFDAGPRELVSECSAYNEPEYSICPGSGNGFGESSAIHTAMLGADGSWLHAAIGDGASSATRFEFACQQIVSLREYSPEDKAKLISISEVRL